MFSSYSTALSGLNAMGDAIDIVGNNLANLNTTGYKETRASFKDMVAQASGDASTQVGLGTGAPLNTRIFSQGTITPTAGPFDAAINGDGFFVVKTQTEETAYTRDGSFSRDKDGFLVTSTGEYVQGWSMYQGVLSPNGPLGNIQIPVGQSLAPRATSEISLAGNLDASAVAGTAAGTFKQEIQVVDSLGNNVPVDITFTRDPSTTTQQWDYSISAPSLPAGSITVADHNATVSSNPPAFAITPGTNDTLNLAVNGAAAQNFTLQASDASLNDVVKDLNAQFHAQGVGATASISASSNALVITSNTAATGGTIQVGTGDANSTLGLPSAGVGATSNPVTGTAVPGLTITQGVNDVVNLSIDGKTVPSLTLKPSDASLKDVANDLNQQFTTNNIGATASVDPVKGLVIKSTNTGPTGSVEVLPTGTANSTLGLTTTYPIQFDSKGDLIGPKFTDAPISITLNGGSPTTNLPDGSLPMTFTWNMWNSDGTPRFTQFSESSAISSNSQDGQPAAQLIGVTLANDGKVVANYSNGAAQQVVAQLAVASIRNPESLIDVGNNN
ncbi:MAG: flagellar hook-basal body complex protein, partial [Acidobacteriaceae bacterium]|nr:flagellar hook-basal body complex protein [Acidobacteriaceae bacterium]